MEQRRKNIRLSKEAYEASSQIFSITVCTLTRRPLFRNETWANLVVGSLETGPFGENTDRYALCLMPDHLHLLLTCQDGNLIDLLSGWKSYSANLLRKSALEGACWQRGFHDHGLRREEDIRSTADYIVNNPVRAGLVENWISYPYSWHRWMQGQSADL